MLLLKYVILYTEHMFYFKIKGAFLLFMKKSNITSNPDMNNQFTSSKNSSKVNSHYKKEINLVETLKKAKEKDQGSILTLINKYYPLVDKYRIYIN